MLVIGTWKNKLGYGEAIALAESLGGWLHERPTSVQIAILPSTLALKPVRDILHPLTLIGAQNVGWDAGHALTGETTGAELREVGCDLVMVGHSERRTFLGETDRHVAHKVETILNHGLTPLICIGEDRAERNEGRTRAVLTRQLDAVIPQLTGLHTGSYHIAYEPAWAITTGTQRLPANPALAAEDHRWIRDHLVEALGANGANVSLIYGAGVNAENAAELASLPKVDGLLVGSASQTLKNFANVIREVEGVPKGMPHR